MARIAMRWAAVAPRPSARSAARTASAKGPPPGTTSAPAATPPEARAEQAASTTGSPSARLPPTFTTRPGPRATASLQDAERDVPVGRGEGAVDRGHVL